ncbi:hypothetical protein [Agrobacterium radiobacter]|uniref:hypothetical protein n=1 Tax=Agrobacterium radiobacter TaxID=362 RepID=UPI003CE56591
MITGIQIDPRNFDKRNLGRGSTFDFDEVEEASEEGLYTLIHACGLLKGAYARFEPNPAIKFTYEDGSSLILPDAILAELIGLKDGHWNIYRLRIKAVLAIALEHPHAKTPRNGKMQVFNIRRGSWDRKNDCVFFSTRDANGQWRHTEEFFYEDGRLQNGSTSAISYWYPPRDRAVIRNAIRTFLLANPLPL